MLCQDVIAHIRFILLSSRQFPTLKSLYVFSPNDVIDVLCCLNIIKMLIEQNKW